MLCTAVATTARAQQCDGTGVSARSQDLYCVELVPAPTVPSATGSVALGWEPGPFSVAVNADGMPRYVPTIVAAGLPAPGTLGAYTVFVAWLATPTMSSVVRLGVVRNGRTRLPVIALDKFLLLVTAEKKSSGSTPRGLVVLRGFSPSARLQPPELMQFALGATRDTSAAIAGASPTHTHAASGAWSGVPMPEGVQMLPAEMALRPAVEPYLPVAPTPPPAARRREVVHLETGDTLYLLAGHVSRTIKGRTVTMYGFNGQYPGPLIDVAQGAEISVEFTNALDQPTTVHWHGIRLANRFDGVPELTQDAVPPGGRYSYQLRFPDAGIYWYHPHVREDAQQDLGLYGNLLVRSPRADYFTPAHREEVLMLDDLLVGDGGPVPYGRDAATHALMGRFGNVMLVNGEPNYQLHVRRGEVVRLYLTNASNTRTLNLSFPGARLKVVGSDVGNFEREAWVQSVVIAPAERYVVLARFDRPGETPLVNRVRALDHLYGRFFDQTDTLATVLVAKARASPDLRATFDRVRTDTATRASLAPFRAALAGPPAKTLILTLETRDLPFLTRQLMQLDSIYFP
ncbi:MAG: multicopper oxidase domain-containing protein, partial [Gemmatimonadales bacterium]|nr:multicopper oxidase domain-containing protein [Gemmatimonadales bacterium]